MKSMQVFLCVTAFLLFGLINSVHAQSGCCSWHGGVCGCGCCDGTPLSTTCAPYYPGCSGYTSYTYDCSNYGMAYYDTVSKSCKCSSGYVVDDSILGNGKCVSGYTYCDNKYGVFSTYNSISNSCGCLSGYNFVGNKCVKQKTNNEICQESLGLSSHYNSLDKTCECSSGYIISKDSFGKESCVSGYTYCYSKYGLFSTYDSLSKSCGCLSGYLLTGSQCSKQATNDEVCKASLGFFSSYNSSNKTCQCSYGYVISKDSLGKEKCVLGVTYCSGEFGLFTSYNALKNQCECMSGYIMKNNQCVKDNSAGGSVVLDIKNSIPEGSIVKTASNSDVYIIKYLNGKQYKRLVLNPLVFKSYGHLKWNNLLIVSDTQMGLFINSDLVRVDGSNDIYKLTPDGDTGRKVKLTTTSGCDLDSVYTINAVDFSNYLFQN